MTWWQWLFRAHDPGAHEKLEGIKADMEAKHAELFEHLQMIHHRLGIPAPGRQRPAEKRRLDCGHIDDSWATVYFDGVTKDECRRCNQARYA